MYISTSDKYGDKYTLNMLKKCGYALTMSISEQMNTLQDSKLIFLLPGGINPKYVTYLALMLVYLDIFYILHMQ